MTFEQLLRQVKTAGYSDVHGTIEVNTDGVFLRLRPIGFAGAEVTLLVSGHNGIVYRETGTLPDNPQRSPAP